MQSGNFLGFIFYSVLIIVTMNLSDQLVIVTCDSEMEDLALWERIWYSYYYFAVFE